jgi:DNA polymerase-3 subunit gamma/tau
MSYIALYRKARPQTFDEVKGQDHVVTTLRNQIKTGRLQHAYLFCGTRGTGKTSVAKLLAKAANCEHPENGSPCGKCQSCLSIQNGNSMNVIEIDAASNNGVDNVREIIEEVQYRPASGKFKVYIIDEAHMLTAGASNALLKTLEEPPSYVIFILATTEVEKIQVTIRSRCQRYDFHRIDTGTIVARMAELMQREGVEAEEKALRFVARAADGSMRDALSLLDQCMAFYMGQSLTYDKVLKALGEADTYVFAGIVRSASRGDTGRVIRTFEKQIANGMEISQFVIGLIGYLRNLLLVGSSTPEDAGETVDATEEQMEELFTLAESVPPETVMRYIRVLSELQSQMRYSPSSRVLTEVALIRISRPQTGTKNDDLLDRIRQMESRLDELLSGRYALPVGNIAAQASAPAPAEDLPSEEPPENAAPEDLIKIRSEWRMILSLLPGGFGKSKTILTQAKPLYDAENPGNHTLYVECSGIADRVVTDEELKKQLERIIEQRYQKHVDVEMHMKKDTTGNLRPIQADEILSDRSRIAMAVEVSDEDF